MFNIKSCYRAVTNESLDARSTIWKIRASQRIRSFMWLCVNGKLLTNSEHVKRGLMPHGDCSRCESSCETSLHALRDCSKVKDMWMRLVKPCHWPAFFNVNFHEWICMNFKKNLGLLDLGWKEVFATACWYFWRFRNEFVFQGIDRMTSDPIFEIFHRVKCYNKASIVLDCQTKAHPGRGLRCIC